MYTNTISHSLNEKTHSQALSISLLVETLKIIQNENFRNEMMRGMRALFLVLFSLKGKLEDIQIWFETCNLVRTKKEIVGYIYIYILGELFIFFVGECHFKVLVRYHLSF